MRWDHLVLTEKSESLDQMDVKVAGASQDLREKEGARELPGWKDSAA